MANLQQHLQVHVQRDGDELEDDEGERREIRIERNNNQNANDDDGNEVRVRAQALRRRTLTRGARVPPETPDFELRPLSPLPEPNDREMARAVFESRQNYPMSILPPTALPCFKSLSDDAYVFMDKYEKLAVGWPDKMKIQYFPQYLEEPALSWFNVERTDRIAEPALDSEGNQSNQWAQMRWLFLKSLFLKEFGESQSKEVFKTRQSDHETGMTFFYKMINLHMRSGVNLDSEQLAALIISNMTIAYRDKFIGKEYRSLESLKKDIKRFDDVT